MRALAAVLALALLVLAAAAMAQQGLAGEEGVLWSRGVAWIQEQQRAFHGALAERLRELSAAPSPALIWSLIAASLLYGIFHAAGPGHGKAVIATYLLSHRELIGRALWLSTASAFCQGLVAVVLVYGLIYLAGWLPRDTQAAVLWSERASYLLLAMLGALLALRALRGLVALAVPRLATAGAHHEHDGPCGHSHGPTPEQLGAAGSLRTAVGVVLSVGLRPCSGAILVLVFAQLLGIPWAGIGAVAAMSAGTAIAVAAIAVLALAARDWSGRLLTSGGRFGLAAVSAGTALLALAGGLAILAIGLSLLLASAQAPHPLGL